MRHTAGLLLIATLLFSGCVDMREHAPPGDLYTGPKNMSYKYMLRGAGGAVEYTFYKGLNDYLAGISRVVYCRPDCPSNESIQKKYLDEPYSEPELSGFLNALKKHGSSREEQALIAISLVQNIPYDDGAYEAGKSIDRYPYQVLYDGEAVCGEKVRLLAYFLGGLGYDTAMLYYPEEKHAALGIKCPMEYSHRNSGYCFIETTTPAIPTYDSGEYPGTGRITSQPTVLRLSLGDSYDNISEQWEDAREWEKIAQLMEKNNQVLRQDDYNKWKN